MATKKELDKRLDNTTGTPGTLQPIPFPDVGAGVGGATGSRRTSVSTPARRTLSPTATSTDQSALARTQRALAIRQGAGGVQGSRDTAESGANAQLAESLRLNLIEQERLSGATFGTVTPTDAIAKERAIRANQVNVAGGITAINSLREGQVARANQLTEADTTLQDRTQQEAGAFDRSLINLDVAETRGEFGLADRRLANQNALDVANTADPVDAERIRIARDLEAGIEGAPAGSRLAMSATLLDQLGGQPGAANFSQGGRIEVPDGAGGVLSLPPDQAEAYLMQTNPSFAASRVASGDFQAGEDGGFTRTTGQTRGAQVQPPTELGNAVSDARGTTRFFGPADIAAPPPRANVSLGQLPEAGGIPRNPAGLTPPGQSRGPQPGALQESRAQRAASQISDLLTNGFQPSRTNSQGVALFTPGAEMEAEMEAEMAAEIGPFLAQLPDEQQLAVFQELGDAVLPYLTIDVTGGR